MIYKYTIIEKYNKNQIMQEWLVWWKNIDEIFKKANEIYKSYNTDRLMLNLEYIADELE